MAEFLGVAFSDNSFREDLSLLLSCNKVSPAQTRPCSQEGEFCALFAGVKQHIGILSPRQSKHEPAAAATSAASHHIRTGEERGHQQSEGLPSEHARQ